MMDVLTHLGSREDNALKRLRAGPLDAIFCGGDLRYLSVNGIEVVRRVHVAVRDDAWGTVAPLIAGVRLEHQPQGFRLEWEGRQLNEQVDFAWTGRAVGTSKTLNDDIKSSILFEMNGVAGRTFTTCRTGICLLHPLRHCTGAECSITHSDGRVEIGHFPEQIAASQPFSDIVAMSQSFPGGLNVKIEFHGEVFETEDQRNWADASFKTYCRPLSMPFPYVLARGQRVVQSLKITVTGRPHVKTDDEALTVTGRTLGRFSGVGLTINQPLKPDKRELLRAMRLAHLRVDVRLIEPHWRSHFLTCAQEAKSLGLKMELAVHADKESESGMEELARLAAQSGTGVCRWIVYEIRRPMPSSEVFAAAQRHFTSAALGCGTVGSFAELNRQPPQCVQLVSYSINPQVHATDDLTLIENIEAQAGTVRSARCVAPGAAVAVGPVTLHRRPDPFAAGKSGDEEPARPDVRQSMMLGAAWMLGSIAALCRAMPNAMTFFDAVGPFGVMNKGEAFPLYRVLADVGEFAGGDVLECNGIDPLKGAAVALRKADRVRLMAASFGEELPVSFSGLESFRITGASVFDGRGIQLLGSLARPLQLAPFSILKVDLESKGGAHG